MRSQTQTENKTPSLTQTLEKISTDLALFAAEFDAFETNAFYFHEDEKRIQESLASFSHRSCELLKAIESLQQPVSGRNKQLQNQWLKLKYMTFVYNLKPLYLYAIHQDAAKLPKNFRDNIQAILDSILYNELNYRSDDWCLQQLYFILEIQTKLISSKEECQTLIKLLEHMIESSNKNFLRIKMLRNLIDIGWTNKSTFFDLLSKHAANLESTLKQINSHSDFFASEEMLDTHHKVQQIYANITAYEYLYLYRYLLHVKKVKKDVNKASIATQENDCRHLSVVMPFPEVIDENELKALLENEAELRERYYLKAFNLLNSINFDSIKHYHETHNTLASLITHCISYAKSMRNLFAEFLYQYNRKTLKLAPKTGAKLSESVATLNTTITQLESVFNHFHKHWNKLLNPTAANEVSLTSIKKSTTELELFEEILNTILTIESNVSVAEERYEWKKQEKLFELTYEEHTQSSAKLKTALLELKAKKAKRAEKAQDKVEKTDHAGIEKNSADESEEKSAEEQNRNIIFATEVKSDAVKVIEFYDAKSLALAKSLLRSSQRIATSLRKRSHTTEPLADDEWQGCTEALESNTCDFESLLKLRDEYKTLRSTIDPNDLNVLDCFEFSIDHLDRLISQTLNNLNESSRQIVYVNNKIETEFKQFILRLGRQHIADHDIQTDLSEEEIYKLGWLRFIEIGREKNKTLSPLSKRSLERKYSSVLRKIYPPKIEALHKQAVVAATPTITPVIPPVLSTAISVPVTPPTQTLPLETNIELTYCAKVILQQDHRGIPGHFNQFKKLPGEVFLYGVAATNHFPNKIKPRDYPKHTIDFVTRGSNPGEILNLNNRFYISKHQPSLCQLKTQQGRTHLVCSHPSTQPLSKERWLDEIAYSCHFTAYSFIIESDGTAHDRTGRGLLDLADMRLSMCSEPNAALAKDPVRGLIAIDQMLQGFSADDHLETALRQWQPEENLNHKYLRYMATQHLECWKPENRLRYVSLLIDYGLLSKMFPIAEQNPANALERLEVLLGLKQANNPFPLFDSHQIAKPLLNSSDSLSSSTTLTQPPL